MCPAPPPRTPCTWTDGVICAPMRAPQTNVTLPRWSCMTRQLQPRGPWGRRSRAILLDGTTSWATLHGRFRHQLLAHGAVGRGQRPRLLGSLRTAHPRGCSCNLRGNHRRMQWCDWRHASLMLSHAQRAWGCLGLKQAKGGRITGRKAGRRPGYHMCAASIVLPQGGFEGQRKEAGAACGKHSGRRGEGKRWNCGGALVL